MLRSDSALPGRAGPSLAAALLVVALAVLLPASPADAAPCSGSLTITRISGGEFDVDTGISPQLTGSYAGYKVTNGGAAIDDLWVKVANFAGGTVTLAPNEDGLVHPGPLATAAETFAYIYLAASGAATGQTHDVQLYEGHPDHGGTQLCADSFSVETVETIKASANKVTAVVSGPSPAELGGIVTMTVTGDTGMVGTGPPGHPDGAGTFKANPATTADWPADAYQLVDTSIDFAVSGTFDDTLIVTDLDGFNQAYTTTFTFVAVGTTATPTQVSPVNFIASGTQIKHTDTGGFGSLSPILPPENHLTLSKGASPTALPATGGRVTYSVTVDNAGSVDASLDDFVDTLPGGAVYVPGSASYAGSPIDDPAISGQVLTFVDVFTVSAGATATLTYQVDLPAVVGNYANQAVAHVTSTQIDASLLVADSQAATVTVAVGDPDDPPVANDDDATTAADTPTTIDVAANDSDLDGNLDPTTVTVTTGPTNGTAIANGDGTVTYTPATGFTGTDTFTYEICDTTALCQSGEVTVTVSAANQAPVADDDALTIDEDVTVTLTVLANDTDSDGDLDPSTVAITTAPPNGTVSVNPDGTIQYTPGADFAGTDTFTYQVCDTSGNCDSATITITVEAVNDAPAYTGTPTVVVPSGGGLPTLPFVDPDDGDETITVTVVGGTLPPGTTLQPDGTWLGQAPSTGTYTFTVEACDAAVPPACNQSDVTLEFGQLAVTGSESGNLLRNGLGIVLVGMVLVGISRIRPWAPTGGRSPQQ